MNNLTCFFVGIMVGIFFGLSVANASHLPVQTTLCDPLCHETTLWLWDADTFVIGSVDPDSERVRILGMDTPERGPVRPGSNSLAHCDCEARLSEIARRRMATLMTRGEVRMVRTPRRDRWGRSLAGVTVNGEDVGTVLIREGLAREYEGGKRESWCN